MYLTIPLDNGGSFSVETDAARGGVVRASPGSSAVRSAGETFESSLSRVRDIADAIIEKLSNLSAAPDHIRAEFGVSLDVEAGVAVVKGAAGAHFLIELEWSRPGSGVQGAGD